MNKWNISSKGILVANQAAQHRRALFLHSRYILREHSLYFLYQSMHSVSFVQQDLRTCAYALNDAEQLQHIRNKRAFKTGGYIHMGC